MRSTTAHTAYAITPRSWILDNEQRNYTLTIHDMPDAEKPREKLVERGPDTLSVQELLAAVLNTGTIKEDVLTMSRRIVRDYGEQSIVRLRSAKKFSQEMCVPLGKAVQILAAMELGRRFFERNTAAAPCIRTARDVFEYVTDMRELPKERLRGLYLNTHYKVIHDEIISIGTVDTNIVHPREVFKPALEYAAVAVVLVHNHPSGSLDPSEADTAITAQLIESGKLLGIELIDHVIVTKDGFTSVPAAYQA